MCMSSDSVCAHLDIDHVRRDDSIDLGESRVERFASVAIEILRLHLRLILMKGRDSLRDATRVAELRLHAIGGVPL
jgi:hypothetical protein